MKLRLKQVLGFLVVAGGVSAVTVQAAANEDYVDDYNQVQEEYVDNGAVDNGAAYDEGYADYQDGYAEESYVEEGYADEEYSEDYQEPAANYEESQPAADNYSEDYVDDQAVAYENTDADKEWEAEVRAYCNEMASYEAPEDKQLFLKDCIDSQMGY